MIADGIATASQHSGGPALDRPCPNHDDAEVNDGEVVLEFKLAIHRQ
jgi:hypothetical protein